MPSATPLPSAQPPTGERRGEWTLEPRLTSARRARALVDGILEGAAEPVRRRAALVTSELVGNGLRHTRGPLALSVDRLADGWLLSLRDDDRTPPSVVEVGPLAEQGRGLLIVARVSADVGWTAAGAAGGKQVWARLTDLTDASDEPSATADAPT